MTPRSISIGEIEIILVRDGADRVPPEIILVGAPPEEILGVAREHADADGQLPVAYNSLLIRTAGRSVLVDAGFGRWGEDEGVAGNLIGGLRTLGVGPASIDDVVISHGHADHIGGLTKPNAQGRHVPIFSRARHWFWEDEWRYWTSEAALASMPRSLADPARAALPPLAAAGLVELTTSERELAPGVRIHAAPGHTPGHVVVGIESAGERGLYVGDAIFHVANVIRPEWACVYDVDGVAATSTRRRLLDEASRDGSLVIAAHLETPGTVEAGSSGYRFLPILDATDGPEAGAAGSDERAWRST